jgi:hypothetical protein
MKANELRIGNWVNNNEEDYQITSATISQLERGDSKAEPIPLTESLLLKFGFEKVKDSFFKKGFHIYEEDNNFYYYLRDEGMMDVHINFVHELQNLYFALTKKELTMK